MNRWAPRMLWATATVALAGGTAFLVTRSIPHGPAAPHAAAEDDFHHWMHEQLQLTPAQHDALDPVEKAFENERARLRTEIASAGRDLAHAVRQGKSGAAEIEAALARLNTAQAALQRATLDHFFAMKDHLEPAQAEKLLQWTHDSILPR
jgi:Spy/CpxP family protein refolding chaperone